MDLPTLLYEALFYVLIISATYADIRKGVVPNSVTFTMIVSGLILNTVRSSNKYLFDSFNTGNTHLNGLLLSICGILIAFAVFYAFFVFGVFAAGDGKLAMGIASFTGAEFFLKSLLFVFAFGFITGLYALIRKKKTVEMFRYIYLKFILHAPLDGAFSTDSYAPKNPTFPYAVNFLFGVISMRANQVYNFLPFLN